MCACAEEVRWFISSMHIFSTNLYPSSAMDVVPWVTRKKTIEEDNFSDNKKLMTLGERSIRKLRVKNTLIREENSTANEKGVDIQEGNDWA